MASTNKVTIVLGAALKTPQSVSFKDATAFTFGTISEAVQFVPANAEVPTGGNSTTTKLTTRGRRPNVIIPNSPRVWRRKESSVDKKLGNALEKSTMCISGDRPRKLNTITIKRSFRPEATTLSTGGKISPHSIFTNEEFVTAGGRMLASPRPRQERIIAFAPHAKKEEESVILVTGNTPVARIFSNPKKTKKRERQQERKKRARQNRSQCPKPKNQAWPARFTLIDENPFNPLRLIKRDSYTVRGLKLKPNPAKQTDSHTSSPQAQKKSIFKNAYDIYKAAKKNTADQVTLTSRRGVNKTRLPLHVFRKRANENYEIHTVRVIEESDPPPAHEAAPARDRIVTRSQSSRMTATPRKNSLSIAAEGSTSAQRGLPPTREEEPEVALQARNLLDVVGNNTNQLLATILNQM